MSKLLDADKALADKKFKLAISLYKEAIADEPDDPLIYRGLAWSLFGARDYSNALAAAQKSIELNPALPSAHVVVSYIYHQQNNYEGFKSEAIQAFEVDPNSSEALACYGAMLLTERKLDDAIEVLNRAIQKAPNDYATNSNLANAYLLKGYRKQYFDQIRKTFNNMPSIRTGLKLVEALNVGYPMAVGIILLSLLVIGLMLRASLILILPLIYCLYILWLSFRLLLFKQWKRGLSGVMLALFLLAAIYLIYSLIRLLTHT